VEWGLARTTNGTRSILQLWPQSSDGAIKSIDSENAILVHSQRLIIDTTVLVSSHPLPPNRLLRSDAMKPVDSIPDICELVVRIEESEVDKGTIKCIADLRINSGDIPIGDEECKIYISKVTISIDVDGLFAKPGSRFGEPRKNNSISLLKTNLTKAAHDSGYSISGNIDVSNSPLKASFLGGGSLKRSTARESTLEASDTVEHLRVRALPNLRWEVSELDDEPLKGTYLENDELLHLRSLEQANRAALSATILVKQRHIVIKQIIRDSYSATFFNRFNTNQRRLLDLLIAKSLSASLNLDGKYRGELKLSEHACEIKNEE